MRARLDYHGMKAGELAAADALKSNRGGNLILEKNRSTAR